MKAKYFVKQEIRSFETHEEAIQYLVEQLFQVKKSLLNDKKQKIGKRLLFPFA